jgi:prephenate dehydratase
VIVAIQGEAGSFSHEAAAGVMGPELELLPCRTFDRLFAAVSSGAAEQGVVPIENSLAGSIHENYDLLRAQALHVVGETQVRVRHCLVARPGADRARVRRVASHPVALAQCRRFFAEQAALEAMPAYDTAGSVRELMEGKLDVDAVIASALAAQLYGATVLRPALEDDPENYTRFLLVARQPAPLGEPSKITLTFTLPNSPGALHRALGVFARHDLNLSKIESRPLPGRPWEYVFYADVGGDPAAQARDALEELQPLTRELRVLGWYPTRPPHIPTTPRPHDPTAPHPHDPTAPHPHVPGGVG